MISDGNIFHLYFQPDKFRAQYAADLPETETKLLALTQRPMAERAMTEVSDVATWKAIPSWFIFGTRDNSIPVTLLAFMAERAGSKKTVTIEGASHAVMMSHADAVVELVEQAASAVRGDRGTASPSKEGFGTTPAGAHRRQHFPQRPEILANRPFGRPQPADPSSTRSDSSAA